MMIRRTFVASMVLTFVVAMSSMAMAASTEIKPRGTWAYFTEAWFHDPLNVSLQADDIGTMWPLIRPGNYLTFFYVPNSEQWHSYWNMISVDIDYHPIPLTDGLVHAVGGGLDDQTLDAIVVPYSAISDVLQSPGVPHPNRFFRTPSCLYDPTVGHVCVANVAKGYPPADGKYWPALMLSPTQDGVPGTWSYIGKLGGEPASEGASGITRTGGSSMAFLLREDVTTPVNHASPIENRFLYYFDLRAAYTSDGRSGLGLLYSADLLHWYYARNPNGTVRDLRPTGFSWNWIFTRATIAPTADGFIVHVWATKNWPPEGVWHFKSTDGLTFVNANGGTQKEFGGEVGKGVAVAVQPDFSPRYFAVAPQPNAQLDYGVALSTNPME